MKNTDKLNVELASKSVELSEYKTYYELTNLVCYYDQPNLNGVKLNSGKDALKYAETLKEMPVYAHYCVNTKGEPSFGGHEVYVDKDGNINFNTTPIGVHTDVCIKDAKVDVGGTEMTLPCLFATQRIWKRNKNACAAILRLYSLGQLHNSWEISSLKYSFENGIKTLEDYVFEGNTFLGFDEKKSNMSLSPHGSTPAYGRSATVVSLSDFEANNELMVAEALARDIVENRKGGEGDCMDNEITQVDQLDASEIASVEQSEAASTSDNAAVDNSAQEESNDSTDVAAENTDAAQVVPITDKAELTDRDIRNGIWRAYYELHDKNVDCDVMQILPESHTAWLRIWDGHRRSELDVVVVTYSVDENDLITIVDEKSGTLTVNVSEINSKIDEMTNALVSANKTIDALKQSVSELSEMKEKYDEYVANEKAEQHQKDCDALKDYMLKSKCFSENEFTSEEIVNIIDALDYAAAKAMIADRLVEKMSNISSDNSEAKPNIVKSERLVDDDSDFTETSKVNTVRKVLLG